MKKLISIQGVRGSYHDQAARLLVSRDYQPIMRDSFAEVFEDLDLDRVEMIVVALANSLVGPIGEVYDLIRKYHFYINDSYNLAIEHCLIGLTKGLRLEDIELVMSHPMALWQCQNWLSKNLGWARRVEFTDTAAAVQQIDSTSQVAIGSKLAAEIYDKQVIANSIQDNSKNFTRFVLLKKTIDINPDHKRVSMVLITQNNPGSLYQALGAFASQGINLTSLVSRPIPDQIWRYQFYIDLEVNIASKQFIIAQDALEKQGCKLLILGSY